MRNVKGLVLAAWIVTLIQAGSVHADGTTPDSKDAQIEQLKDQVRIWKARADYSDRLLEAVRNDVANCAAALSKEKEKQSEEHK